MRAHFAVLAPPETMNAFPVVDQFNAFDPCLEPSASTQKGFASESPPGMMSPQVSPLALDEVQTEPEWRE